MRHILITLLLAVAVTLVAPRALAEEQEMQMLAVASPDVWENAKALTGAMRRAIRRAEGWTVAPGEYSLEVMGAALDCPEPPDEPCLKKIAEKVKAQRIIWGDVKKSSENEVTAHLRLWQEGQTKKETTFTYSKNLTDDTDDSLLELAEKALLELVGKPSGTLVIAAGNVDGEVLVNGLLVGLVKKGQAKLDVPSGKLTVLVEAPGYENLLGTVVVPPGGSATLRLDPVPVQEGGPEEPDLGLEEERDRPMSKNKIYGYASLGVGGAAVLAGTIFWIVSYNQAHDEKFERYVNETPRDQDPCVRARNERASNITKICDSNVTSRYLSFTMYGLGAVLGGLGAYLLLTDDGSNEEGMTQAKGVRVQPLVGIGPNAGRLDLRVTF